MEFLRFGSSIPGGYWGCCACDIIQDLNQDPDEKSSIQLVDGDGGHPLTGNDGFMFAGPTYRDIFLQRLRYGTFNTTDMPNHGFIVILTDWQISSPEGGKWLKLLKEQGFEFIRTVDNSVYSGDDCYDDECDYEDGGCSAHPNYIFGLFRNVGEGAVADPYTPPRQWTDLPDVVPEAWSYIAYRKNTGEVSPDTPALAKDSAKTQKKIYDALPKNKFLSEKEVVAAGAPVIYAGERSQFPQESKESREYKKGKAKAADPFAPTAKAGY